MQKTGLPIGTCVTAAKDSIGNMMIIMDFGVIDYTSHSNSMMAFNQLQQFVRVHVDGCQTCFKIDGRAGHHSLEVDNLEVPFELGNHCV